MILDSAVSNSKCAVDFVCVKSNSNKKQKPTKNHPGIEKE